MKADIDKRQMIEEALDHDGTDALRLAVAALEADPINGNLLTLAAMAAIKQEDPNLALRYTKRLDKWYSPSPVVWACQAIALAQSGRWPVAQSLFSQHQIDGWPTGMLFPPGMTSLANTWFRKIKRWAPHTDAPKKRPSSPKKATKKIGRPVAVPVTPKPLPTLQLKPLPRPPPRVSVNFTLSDSPLYALLDQPSTCTTADFLLKSDFSRLALLKGFDELLCITMLRGIDHYWYQVETVRKVLKQFRGRVLLADEVGLGKTIEAGMVLKEYILRGMATHVLVLTPPSLVGQWQEEMETKFDIDFITSHSPLLRRDPATFWNSPRIIASIATARLARHLKHLTNHTFDIVIVDEAHHLKNRTSSNWKLVDALKKRFLLLLSATPVQNSLVELYNLLTLLKPGLFKTEREFRASYVEPRHPRIPVNRESLQDLMRGVMIRNTRSLVDVRLPPRQVLTLRIEPSDAERSCYTVLTDLMRSMGETETTHHRLALHHLLQAAGSSHAAVTAALGRFLKHDPPPAWQALHDSYAAISSSAKCSALFDLLERNPDEKKLVFVSYHETLDLLDTLFQERGIRFARFDGQMSGPRKDEAVARFSEDATVLLCTESGGEGRNLQFCNTMINFDLHWNPQRIEQRIGRIHRIGQEREVFVFNLAVRNTIEDRILRILDEKINMFELVVGEVQSILGEMEDQHDFTELVFAAWIRETDSRCDEAFDEIGESLLKARQQYEAVKSYDDELFGEEFEVV